MLYADLLPTADVQLRTGSYAYAEVRRMEIGISPVLIHATPFHTKESPNHDSKHKHYTTTPDRNVVGALSSSDR